MIRRILFAIFVLFLLAAGHALAQKKPQKNAQPQSAFEPFKAEKSVEIGMFYLKKKNYDAAIERFLDAVRFKPGFARQHFLLGQAYEGKGEFEDAITHYTAYLEILPNADNASKVRMKIDSLNKKVERAKARRNKANRGA